MKQSGWRHDTGFWTGLAWAGLLSLVLVGVPTALIALVGWPWPGWAEPSQSLTLRYVSHQMGLDLGACGAWAVLLSSVSLEAAAQLRGRPARIQARGPLGTLVARGVWGSSSPTRSWPARRASWWRPGRPPPGRRP